MQKIIIFLIVLGFLSCKKDPNNAEHDHNHSHGVEYTNDVLINITHVADNFVLQLMKDTFDVYPGMPQYINADNDTFSVSVLKYYISNIKLKRPDGSYYIEPESYHLINAADSNATCKLILKNVPIENYISIDFLIGVDSARNCSGAQSGDLDPVKDMFWDWSQGYIFFKFEGNCPAAPGNTTTKNVVFHVGGFTEPFNNICAVSVPFTTGALNVEDHNAPVIYIKTNLQEVFKNPEALDFANYHTATSINDVKKIIANYTDMFTVVAIKN